MEVQISQLDRIIWNNSTNLDVFGSGKIVIWQVKTSALISHLETFKTLLSLRELEKALRYKQENDRQTRIISRAVLRILLGRYTGIDPKTIRFAVDQDKKPVLENAFSNSLHFNVSHSGNRILIVIANTPVGIDLEQIDASFTYQNMLDLCFSLDEINYINQSKLPAESFYQLWTRKEALLKASGQGLTDQLNQVPSLDGNFPIPAIIHTTKNWQITSFKVDASYIASIAFYPVKTALFFLTFNFN